MTKLTRIRRIAKKIEVMKQYKDSAKAIEYLKQQLEKLK